MATPCCVQIWRNTKIAPPIGNNIRAVGIGNFSVLGFGATPQARLHVNSFYFPATNPATTFIGGNLFRTDGDQAVRNQWQMFNGTSATTTNEIGVIFTDPTTSSQLFAGQHAITKIKSRFNF